MYFVNVYENMIEIMVREKYFRCYFEYFYIFLL